MEKKSKLLVLVLSSLALASCGNTQESVVSSLSDSISNDVTTISSNNVQSSTSSSVNTSSSNSSSSSIINKKSAFELALSQDYSNITAEITQSYENGENVEYCAEYYYNGYTIVYDEVAALNGSDTPYLYYHDYEGKNYLYYEPNKETNSKTGAWLNKGYKDTDLSLGKAYFNLSSIFEHVKAEDVIYQSGYYFINSKEKIDELNEYCFSFAWFNTLSDIAFTVDEGVITSIVGFDDLNNDKNFVKVKLTNRGTTVFTLTKLPDAPTKDTIMEYWQYKGYDGPFVEKYIKSIEIAVDESATKIDSYDAVIDIEKGVKVNYTFLPEDATKKTINWISSNEDVAKIDFDKDGNRIIYGVGEGEATIYAYNNENKDETIKSNEIKVKVNGLQKQNKEGAVYDLTYTAKVDNKVGVNNSLNNNLPCSVKANKATLTTGENSTIWTKDDKVLYLNPSESGEGNAYVYYDFDDQQVSGISFYYGLYYSNGMNNLNWIQDMKIETSNDGETWESISILDEVKENVSYENLKLMEKTFSPSSKVRISMDMNFIGKYIHFGFTGMTFIADENCKVHKEFVNIPVTDITISSSKDFLFAGQTMKLTSLVEPSNATDATLVWTSSNESAATISSDGTIKALDVDAAYEVTFTATNVASGVKSNEVKVTINPKITLDEKLVGKWEGETDDSKSLELVISSDEKLVATLKDETPVTLSLVNFEDRYYIFQDENGNEVRIMYSSSLSNTANVNGTINETTIAKFVGSREYKKIIPLESISLSLDNTTIKEGTTGNVKATLSPKDVTDSSLTWSSSDETIATVSKSGLITAIKAGKVTITAKGTNSVKGEIEVTVIAKSYPTSISVTGKNETTTEEKVQLTATISPKDVTEKELTWSSNDKTIATVDKNGLVTPLKAGKVTIKATSADGKVEGSIEITINAPTSNIPSSFVGTYSGYDTYSSETTFELLESGKLIYTNITYYETIEFEFKEVDSNGYYVFTNANEGDITLELTGSSAIYHGDDWSGSSGSAYIMDGNTFEK